jgi:putative hydrolase
MSQESFGDVPLFREIQRILAAGEGPLNLEIARQVGNAIATQGMSDTDVSPEVGRSLDEAVRDAERLVTGYARKSFDEPVLSRGVGIGWWVESTLTGWKWLLEHLADHFSGELGRLGGESEQANPVQAAMGQMAPLLVGIQAGVLVGNLAQGALGRYDFPIPRKDDERLFFVVPNIERVRSDYEIDAGDLHRWLAVHDVARHLAVRSAPWVPGYFRSLLVEIVDATELDSADLERRLIELQSMGMDALQEGAGAGQTLPVVPTERHRRALDRLRAFLGCLEGYAGHIGGRVAPELVEDAARIDESLARHKAARAEMEKFLEQILGVSVDRKLESQGETFAAAVVKLHGIEQLNKVWDAPDNLPTIEEIRDPFAWMERVLGEADGPDPAELEA